MESPNNSRNPPQLQAGGGDYFKTIVKPLLVNGNEEKLCEWLKKVGLISKQMACNNEGCNAEPMKWSKARVIDRFNWVCHKCKKKLPIRHETFLADLKCDLGSIFTAMEGWCYQRPLAEFSDSKVYRVAVGKRIYTACSTAAENYIKTHPETCILGGETADGEDAVVIVDIFPDGMMTIQPLSGDKYSKKVLCVADTSHIPARIWAKVLDENLEESKNEIIALVTEHVKPNSTIVTSHALYPLFKNSSVPYTEIINIKTLMNYDPAEHLRSLKNIETIWATTVEFCQQIQTGSDSSVEQQLYELQWRQIFGTDMFRSIIQQVSSYFRKQHSIPSSK